MSKVGTYVQAEDGLFYKNPVLLFDVVGYICFDDTEPPEFVLKKLDAMTTAKARLKMVHLMRNSGVKFKGMRECHLTGTRMFPTVPENNSDLNPNNLDWTLHDAFGAFFDLEGPIPVPKLHEGTVDMVSTDCVFHYFEYQVSLEMILRIFASPKLGLPVGLISFFYGVAPYTVESTEDYKQGLRQRVFNQLPWLREWKPKKPYQSEEEINEVAHLIIGKYGTHYQSIKLKR